MEENTYKEDYEFESVDAQVPMDKTKPDFFNTYTPHVITTHHVIVASTHIIIIRIALLLTVVTFIPFFIILSPP